jgi:hypothetical protein
MRFISTINENQIYTIAGNLIVGERRIMTILKGPGRLLVAIKAALNTVPVFGGTIASLVNSMSCVRRFSIGMVLSMALAGASIPASSSELEVLLIDYPPYYTVKPDGRIDGFIVDSASKIFARAGIEYKFSFGPPKRVLVEIKSRARLASLGLPIAHK